MAAPCVSNIKAAAGRPLSDEEVMQILHAVEQIASARRAKNAMRSATDALKDAAKDLTDAQRFAAAMEKRSRLKNVIAKQGRFEKYALGGKKISRTLSALNVGGEGPRSGVAMSVEAEWHALSADLLGPMIGELRKAGILDALRSRNQQMDRDVATELWRRTDKNAPASGSKIAEQAAEIIGRYQEMVRLMQNEAGAFIRKQPGWIVRQSHDAYRIGYAASTSAQGRVRRGRTEADFKAWRDFIAPLLDERTFGGTDAANKSRDKFLEQIWLNLVTGDHHVAGGSADWLGGFSGPGNLAKRLSSERVLHFKGAAEWFQYNQRFGRNSLFEEIVSGLDHGAKNTALMRTWGTNPEAAFEADLQQLKDQARNSKNLKEFDRLNGWRIRGEFDALTGAASVPGNVTGARIGEIIRNLQSMAKLGGVVLSSFPDIAVRASALRHHGIPFTEGLLNGLESVMRGRDAGARREIADYIGVGFDGVLGSMLGKFNATDGVAGKSSKLMDLFFRANLLTWWTDSMKTGAGLILSRNLARNLKLAWGEIDRDLQRSLNRFGISERDWGYIQNNGTIKAEGVDYVTADNLPADIRTKMRAYFVDTVNESMTIGGAKESAIRTLGTKPGTWVGEAMRYLMQFKSFPITFYTRQIKRELQRKGRVDGAGVALLIAGTTAMGYLSMSAKDLVKGKEPRDALASPAMAAKTLAAAMQQGGGLGIYGDFLFGQYSRFGGGGLETLLGPTFGAVSDLLKIYGKVKEGEDVGSESLRLVTNNTPFVNLFYARMALDYTVLWQIQEWMNPGWAERFEKRVKEDNNQSFIISPTEAVK